MNVPSANLLNFFSTALKPSQIFTRNCTGTFGPLFFSFGYCEMHNNMICYAGHSTHAVILNSSQKQPEYLIIALTSLILCLHSYNISKRPTAKTKIITKAVVLQHDAWTPVSPWDLPGGSQVKSIFLIILSCYLSFPLYWHLHGWCKSSSG